MKNVPRIVNETDLANRTELIEHAAMILWLTYKALQRAGFTEAQAFELVKLEWTTQP